VLVATKGGYRPGEGRHEVLGEQIEQSLRTLRVEAIGLYYLHRVDPETPLEESLSTIKAYVDRGAIRAVGISEVSVEQVERARRVVPIAAVQNRYNVADRRHDDVVDYCEREGIAFVAYFPLRGDGGSATVKLASLLRRSPVVLPIPGTLSIEHLRQNLRARLTDHAPP
jgi:aryl-alcohol dehydrogenase-like predicted oxidoreductase